MPSKSPEQAKLMRAVAHSPKFASKVGIPQEVGEEFNEADKAKAAVSVLRRKPGRPKKQVDYYGS